jgi:hypothetical protein
MVPVFLALSVLSVALVIWASVWARREREAFNRRFPPISDAEFLARCRPGTSPLVALGLRRIVAEYLGVEYERVYPSMRFLEDLGAD